MRVSFATINFAEPSMLGKECAMSESMRAKFMAEISIYDPSMFIWIDESGFDNRNSVGYSLRGMRPVDHRR